MTAGNRSARVTLCLGESAESDFEQYGHELQPGEVLVVFTDSAGDAVDGANRPLGEAGLAEALQGKLHFSAEELVAVAREALSTVGSAPADRDLTILVVKRTPLDGCFLRGRLKLGLDTAGMAELADA